MASTVIKNWDNKTWLSSKDYIESFNNFLIENLRINSNSKILDIGCGRGKILGSLRSKLKLKEKPLGIDIVNHKDREKRTVNPKGKILIFTLDTGKNEIPTFKLMKNKLNKSLNRDKKILKIITDLYPQRIKKRFIFNVKIDKEKYLDMIKKRYISTLIPLSKKQLTEGIQEIELKYRKVLRFKDKLICIIL